MKIINIQDVKHPISLYTYDTPGDVENIKEDAVIFPEVDIIFMVFNGDYEEQLAPKSIGVYNQYVTKMLAKNCPKALSMVPHVGNSEVPAENDASQVSPQGKALGEASKKNKIDQLDDSLLTPLHYLHSMTGQEEEKDEYPKVVYVFTHRDKIDAKGTAYDELMHKKRLQLLKLGLITKSLYVVSSKIVSDIHILFKREIQLKLKSCQLFKK